MRRPPARQPDTPDRDPDPVRDDATPIIPTPGSYRPGAVNVRLVCPPDVMAAALASLTGFYGDAWQTSAREPAPSSDGHLLQFGTLIVPVPVSATEDPRP